MRRLALIPQCPKEIVREIERLLQESTRLDIEKDRIAFANAARPFVSRFDKANWAVVLERAISARSPRSRELLQAALRAKIQLTRKALASLFRVVGNTPALIAILVSFAAAHGLPKFEKAIELSGSAVEFLEAVHKRLTGSPKEFDQHTCVCMFVVIASTDFSSSNEEKKERLLRFLWSKATASLVSHSDLSLLAESCAARQDRDRFTELTSERHLRGNNTPNTLIKLTNTEVQLEDRACFGRLLSIALQRPGSPFDSLEHGIWLSFLQGSLDLKDYHVFMRIFEHLHSRVDYLHLRDWGKQIRNALFLLPKDEATRVREVFYYDEVDSAKCLRTLQTAPLPSRHSGRGDWPFVGAGRVLMRWLINGYYPEVRVERGSIRECKAPLRSNRSNCKKRRLKGYLLLHNEFIVVSIL